MSDPQRQPSIRSDEDLSGRQLGDFRLLRRLGQGAMAEVYLAEQASLRRQVAVKVLRSRLAEDQTYVQRFRREAQAAAALVHANIVQIYEVGEVEQVHYIAQEYVQGQNLKQWLQRNSPPGLRTTLAIMRQAAAALAKAADQGIVHRDIKPENILLARSGEVKVADFGLAQLSSPDQGAQLTQVGITVGTPLYMSPEQVEGKPLDPRSDLYSLGVTCYHMLAGSPPFSGDTALSVAVQHLKKQPVPLEQVRPDLPPALCRIVHRMMAKTPDARYASAREVLRELHHVQTQHLDDPWPEGLPGWDTAGLDLAPTARADATQRLDVLMKTVQLAIPKRSRWTAWVAAALAAFLIGGVLGLVTTGDPPLLAGGTELAAPKKESAFAQWLFASSIGTEEGWESIKRYFGEDQYWCRRADQKLALVYLYQKRYGEAMAIFQEMARLGAAESEFRAFGLAGEYVVYALREQYDRAAVVLAELAPIRNALRDEQMKQLLREVVRRTAAHADDQTARQWKEFINEQFPDAG
ncbi:MAG: serine/threonine protein kinase [Pirellulales bacterium]|nr:serine/threonine protein kinase [Pirellulales bacterium]